MIQHSGLIAVTFIAYVLLMLYLGWRARQRLHDIRDYLLAGRGIGRWVGAVLGAIAIVWIVAVFAR